VKHKKGKQKLSYTIEKHHPKTAWRKWR